MADTLAPDAVGQAMALESELARKTHFVPTGSAVARVILEVVAVGAAHTSSACKESVGAGLGNVLAPVVEALRAPLALR